ncbi:hypothetical protein HQ590_12860 [bacterium]|nr:hypothetical protein [bacterium]
MRWASVTLVGLVVLSALSRAEPDVPRLRNAQAGFGAQIRNRAWTPLMVEIENPGAARTALLVGECRAEFAGQRVLFQRPVHLPAESFRRFEFPILPDLREPYTGERVNISPILLLRLTDGHLHEWDRLEVLANPLPEDCYFVLFADSEMSSYTFLRDTTVGPEKRPLGRAVIRPRALPKRVLDYQGVDALVLGRFDDDPPGPLQVQALRDWVTGGGHLIVLPTAADAPAKLQALYPVVHLGTNTVETIPEVAGSTRFADGIGFARLVPRDGTVRLGTPARPIVVQRRQGLGRVTALALDTNARPYQNWPDAAALFLELFADPPQFHQYADRVLERAPAATGILSSLAGIRVPGRRALLGYLAVVGGAIVLVLLLARLTRVPEWGWAAAVIVALAGGAVAVGAALRWKAQPAPFLSELSVVVVPRGGQSAGVRSLLGLFSPQDTGYQLGFDSGRVALRPGRSVRTPPETITFDYEDLPTVADWRVRENDIRVVTGSGPRAPGPLPRAEITVGADGLSAKVSNLLDQDLQDCFFKYHRFVVPVGDLVAGENWERQGLSVSADGYTSRLVRSATDELRTRVRAVFFPDPVFSLQRLFSFEEHRFFSHYRGRETGPVCYGWTDSPEFPVATVTPPVRRRAVTLWAVEPTVRFAGDRILLPKGSLELRLFSKAAATHDRGGGRFAGMRPALIQVEFRLPDGCPPLHVEEATVHLQFRGSAFAPVVLVAPADRVTTANNLLEGYRQLTGSPPWRLSRADRDWFDPQTRSLTLAVRVDAAPGMAGTGEAMLLGLSQWQVRELDVELKGSVR